MHFALNDKVSCSHAQYANKTGIVHRLDTLKLKKDTACIVKFDHNDSLVMVFTKYLTKI